MTDPVEQQVIDFVATYCDVPPETLSPATTFESLGVTGEDKVTLIMELEDSFGLTYETGDDKGIYNISQAVDMIRKKLGGD